MRYWILLLLSMSVSGGILAGAVFLLRLALRKKISKAVFPVLWALIGLRLVLPFTIATAFSPIPEGGILQAVQTNLTAETNLPGENRPCNAYTLPDISSLPGTAADPLPDSDASPETPAGVRQALPDDGPVSPVPEPEKPAEASLPDLFTVLFFVWIAGVIAMTLYFVISSLKLCRIVREAVRGTDGFYYSDRFDSPFVFGFFRPLICLPADLSEEELRHVTQHESTHIRRGDHWVKPLAFLILSMHWFNPLVWLAYGLLCRDIEFACDEKAVRNLNPEEKQCYGETLLRLSTANRLVRVCPVAFGAVGVKERIRSLFSGKKPSLILTAAAVLLVLGLCSCLFSERSTEDPGTEPGITEPTDEPGTAEPGTTPVVPADTGTIGLVSTQLLRPYNYTAAFLLPGAIDMLEQYFTLIAERKKIVSHPSVDRRLTDQWDDLLKEYQANRFYLIDCPYSSREDDPVYDYILIRVGELLGETRSDQDPSHTLLLQGTHGQWVVLYDRLNPETAGESIPYEDRSGWYERLCRIEREINGPITEEMVEEAKQLAVRDMARTLVLAEHNLSENRGPLTEAVSLTKAEIEAGIQKYSRMITPVYEQELFEQVFPRELIGTGGGDIPSTKEIFQHSFFIELNFDLPADLPEAILNFLYNYWMKANGPRQVLYYRAATIDGSLQVELWRWGSSRSYRQEGAALFSDLLRDLLSGESANPPARVAYIPGRTLEETEVYYRPYETDAEQQAAKTLFEKINSATAVDMLYYPAMISQRRYTSGESYAIRITGNDGAWELFLDGATALFRTGDDLYYLYFASVYEDGQFIAFSAQEETDAWLNALRNTGNTK